jgi:hypothetical protein
VQGRYLVAQRFAAAGGHKDKGVLTLDEPLDDLVLMGPERIVPEDGSQTCQGIFVHICACGEQ